MAADIFVNANGSIQSLGTELHHHRSVRGSGDTTRNEQHDRELLFARNLLHQLVGSLKFLCRHEQLVIGFGRQRRDFAPDGANVLGGLRHVTGTGFTLRANHRGTFGDATKRLTKICSTADEWNSELPLINMVLIILKIK